MDNGDFFQILAFQELFKFHSKGEKKCGYVKKELKRVFLPASGLTFSKLGLLCCQTAKPHKAKGGFSLFAWFEGSRRFHHLRKEGQPHPGWVERQAGAAWCCSWCSTVWQGLNPLGNLAVPILWGREDPSCGIRCLQCSECCCKLPYQRESHCKKNPVKMW